ncbi:class IIb bacteriocin, lactobin A/cerein 7B family [Streptococcus suis]|uniref:class IIb bacteriocin, lactobin A/cerein 7B family n=1 Tax=Streptococcus suis TaxID=1307 RepID=UPI003706D025
MSKFETIDNINTNFVSLSEQELMETDGGLLITFTAGGVVLFSITGKALAATGLIAAGATAGYLMP